MIFFSIYFFSILELNGLNNILIIRLSSLGDVLLTTPLVRTIKNKYPNISIDFLVKEEFKDLVAYNPYISNVFIYKKNADNFYELLSSLKKQNYNLIVDLQNNLRSKKIIKKLRVKSVKFQKHSINKLLLVKFKINRLNFLPQIPVRYANSLNNFTLDDKGLDLFLPDNITSVLNKNERIIGFAPGSKHFTKMWPIEYFILLAKLLINNGFKIALFGGRSDKDDCKTIKDAVPEVINLSNDNNIFQTARDMKNCLALVCNDSGLMHVACAIKIPVLVLFGSTVKEFGFTPYKNKNLILENNSLDCRPCSHIGRSGCPKKHFACMKSLSPEITFDKLKELLK